MDEKSYTQDEPELSARNADSATRDEPPAKDGLRNHWLGTRVIGCARRLSSHGPLVHLILVVNTVLVVVVLTAVLSSPKPADLIEAKPNSVQVHKTPDAPVADAPVAKTSETPDRPSSAGLTPAVLWQDAENLFAKKKYAEALPMYRQLLDNSLTTPVDKMLCDLFRLRIGQCLRQVGQLTSAGEQLRQAADSISGIVRAASNHQLALINLAGGQHLLARLRAYLALSAMAHRKQLALRTDCEFIVARAITDKVLSLYGQTDSIPWSDMESEDIFAGLDDQGLRRFLAEGSLLPGQAILGPVIEKTGSQGVPDRWSVIANNAPLEELLNNFASESHLDIRWVSINTAARRRAVTMVLDKESEQCVGEIACGSAGLLARFTGDEIRVHNPVELESFSRQCNLLTKEAVSAWRRFFLRVPDDPRTGEAHFALGRVYDQAGDLTSAMREYQLVFHRFAKDKTAPLALLRCAELRTHLCDYDGARGDLLDLLDTYPNFQSSGKVYLYLGQATMKGGLMEEAVATFRKLYYLNLSPDSKMQACLGAAQCLYAKGEYKEASKWLKRYLDLAGQDSDGHLAEALAMLGKCQSELGDVKGAARTLQNALAQDPPQRQRVDIILKLAELYLSSRSFVPALGIIESVGSGRLSIEQAHQLLMLTVRTYREMGLSEKAVAILRDRMDTFRDRKIRGSLTVELARCVYETGDLNESRDLLMAALPSLENGPPAHRAICDLAEVCLKLGNHSQAITMAEELLKLPCSSQVRLRTLDILGTAWALERDYRKASLAFSGMWPEQPGGPKQ